MEFVKDFKGLYFLLIIFIFFIGFFSLITSFNYFFSSANSKIYDNYNMIENSTGVTNSHYQSNIQLMNIQNKIMNINNKILGFGLLFFTLILIIVILIHKKYGVINIFKKQTDWFYK
jgi:hypothetical protein